MWHWLCAAWSTYVLHPLHGNGYQFWSGAGSDLSEIALIGGLIGLFRAHNCHVRGCWRIGHHRIGRYRVCRTHHPHMPDRAPTRSDLIGEPKP